MNQALKGNGVVIVKKGKKIERGVNKERTNKEKKLQFEIIKVNRRRERIVKNKQKMKGVHICMQYSINCPTFL